MRILQVNFSNGSGGASIVSNRLAAGYRARGHETATAVGFKVIEEPGVFAIPNDRSRGPIGRAGELAKANIWRSHSKPVRGIGEAIARGSQPLRSISRLRGHEDFDFPGTARLLDLPPRPPDVLHLHNLHGGYFDLRRLPELSNRLPTLITLHDAWLLSGHCAHSFGCERWRTGCGQCPDLTIYPSIPTDGTAFNWERKREIFERSRLRIASPARWLAERIDESILAPAALEVRVIPQGVDLGVFSPGPKAEARRRLGLDPGAFVVLFAAHFGRSNDFKDVEMLRQAIEEIGRRAARPTLLLCLGDEAPTEALGGAEIRYLGHTGSPAGLVPYYRAADVYVQASKAETFPNTVVEALACGTPVIGTAVGGIPEQIEEGATGWLVEPGDAQALAQRALELADDEEQLLEAGRRAAARAKRDFDLNQTVDAYLDWFEEMAAEGVPPASRSSSQPDSSRIRSR